MKIYSSIDQLIGNTPLFDVSELFGNKNKVFAKIESFNPAGSIKDRAALYMLNEAEKQGLIKKGGTIIEPTSGNTGIGLSAIAIPRGYRVILTMPDSMSKERISILKAHGASVVLTDGTNGMQGAIDKANSLKQEIKNSIILSQFSNKSNALSHYYTTGPEIWKDTDGEIEYLVACVGTSGTIVGTGTYLKEKNNSVKIVAVEPKNSKVLKGEKAGAHKIQGIGANFIPELYNAEIVDEIIDVSDEKAFYYAKQFSTKFGLLVGISSGAALSAVEQLILSENLENEVIVAILPDGGEKYISTGLFD